MPAVSMNPLTAEAIDSLDDTCVRHVLRELVNTASKAREALLERTSRHRNAREAKRREKQHRSLHNAREAILEALARAEGCIETVSNLQIQTGHKRRAFQAAIEKLLGDDEIVPWCITRRNGQTYDAFQLSQTPLGQNRGAPEMAE
jgi:hypothetical protein